MARTARAGSRGRKVAVSGDNAAIEREAQLFIKRGREDPVGWVYSALGRRITRYQQRILELIRDKPRVSIRSCNAVGKDFSAGCATLWWVHQWDDATVVTTAPTWHQVETIQWKREIHKLYEDALIPLGGRMMTTEYRLSPERVAFGISTNNKEALQGIHSDHLLVIVTEASASEFDDELWEGVDALLAGGMTKLLMLSNPTRQEGQFFRSHHSEQDQWATMKVSAFQTPNIEACAKMDGVSIASTILGNTWIERPRHQIPEQCSIVVPGITTHEWVSDMYRKHGLESDFYRVHVLGDFPQSGADVVIPLEWIELAKERSYGELYGG